MGMNARKRIYLDINPADRARLLVSATAYAPYGGEANRLCRHMADILERTFLK